MGILCRKKTVELVIHRRKGIVTYRNLKYGFAFDFPLWWLPYIKVPRKSSIFNPKETTLNFRFRYKSKVYNDAFFWVDLSTLTGKAWRRYFADSPVTFLTQRTGMTYGYGLATEAGEIVNNPKALLIARRIYNKVPKAMKSIRLIKRCK